MERKKPDRLMVMYIFLIAGLVLGIRYFGEICTAVGHLLSIISPLLLGLVIAYILNIVLKKVEQMYFPGSKSALINKSRRIMSIFLSILLIVGAAVLVVKLVVPELVNAFLLIGKGIPIYFEKIRDWLVENSGQFPTIAEWVESMELDWGNMAKTVISYITSGVGGILNSTFSLLGVLAGGVMDTVVSLIFAIYLLMNKEKLFIQTRRFLTAYLKPEAVKKIGKVCKVANETFSRFISGQCTEAVILGCLCTIGMFLFRFPYAPMIGAFIGATALIPVVGAYLGGAVGVFMIFMVSPIKAVLFVVFLVVLQQLEGNLIYPRVVGSSIGLPGIWVLAAVTVGGGFGGIVGMLLGVPLAATAYKLLRMDVKQRLERTEKHQKEKK